MPKLLIIDDEMGITEEVKSFFEEEGFEVFVADTGKTGIEMLEAHLPDVVLIDMKLPDMSGLHVLKACKDICPNAKTIVNTGYVDQTTIDEAEKLGRDVFLQKPFDLMLLKNEVDRLLGLS